MLGMLKRGGLFRRLVAWASGPAPEITPAANLVTGSADHLPPMFFAVVPRQVLEMPSVASPVEAAAVVEPVAFAPFETAPAEVAAVELVAIGDTPIEIAPVEATLDESVVAATISIAVEAGPIETSCSIETGGAGASLPRFRSHALPARLTSVATQNVPVARKGLGRKPIAPADKAIPSKSPQTLKRYAQPVETSRSEMRSRLQTVVSSRRSNVVSLEGFVRAPPQASASNLGKRHAA